ncbi:MAG: patatin-like phospholipase family protein [Clostridia bacterium]|nr:patatin-like phospholipase family protein [Clostridia bacterium]
MLFKKKTIDESGKVIKRKGLKIGIAFGGGGARGVGHIGVVKALEELGIKADMVAGTSAGSMVASLYATGYTSSQMIEELKKLRPKDIRDSKVIWKPSNSENIEQVMKNIFGKDLMFSELQIPLTIVAVDIKTGDEADITSGSVAKASSGSCAVPGIFSPVVYEDMHLVDGGLHNTVPADVVRFMGADKVIAVEVNRARGNGTDSLKTLDVLKTSLGIMMQANVSPKLEYADLIIKPNLESYSSSKIGDIDAMVQEGYEMAMSHKDELIALATEKPKRKVNSLWNKLNKARGRK